MGITIGKAAEKVGLSVYTLRYYDKEGLLPFVDRSPSGTRCFKESDFEWLAMIQCLKNTGMTIRDIHEFVGWCMEGDATLQKRLDMFLAQKKEIQARMTEFQNYLNKIEYKINYYENAIRAANVVSSKTDKTLSAPKPTSKNTQNGHKKDTKKDDKSAKST